MGDIEYNFKMQKEAYFASRVLRSEDYTLCLGDAEQFSHRCQTQICAPEEHYVLQLTSVLTASYAIPLLIMRKEIVVWVKFIQNALSYIRTRSKFQTFYLHFVP